MAWTSARSVESLRSVSPSGTKSGKSLRRDYKPSLSIFSTPHQPQSSSTRTACPTKLPVCRLQTSVASEVGTTRTRTIWADCVLPLLLRDQLHQTLLKLYFAEPIQGFSFNPEPVPKPSEK